MARAHTHRRPGQVIQRNNHSGVAGVYRTKGARGYPCWVAYYNRDREGNTVHRHRRFYFTRGRTEKQAKEAAMLFRLMFDYAVLTDQLKELFDNNDIMIKD